MSFILEALKKSEQQRQQQDTSPQKVRKRTLSLSSHRSARWPYWLVAGSLSLAILSGWWLYRQSEPTPEPSSMLNRPLSASVVLSPPEVVEPKVAPPASVPRLPAAAAAPAPVPRDVVSYPPVLSSKASAKSYEPAAKPRRMDASTAKQTIKVDEQVATVVINQSQSQNIDAMPSEPMSVQLPRYLDLSRELNDLMPRLTMSMHFYTTTPGQRLVRINNRLLHEGDWLGSDLQIVEITATGANLDFLGKLFEMRSPRR